MYQFSLIFVWLSDPYGPLCLVVVAAFSFFFWREQTDKILIKKINQFVPTGTKGFKKELQNML